MSTGLSYLRKKKLPVLIFTLTLVFVLSVFAGRNAALDVMSGTRCGHTLVIDAGHGGVDCGAIAPDGSKESDINLAIAQRLRAAAEFYALDNVMIRQDDSTRSTTETYSEYSDLVCRAELVNAAVNPVLISIHQNSYPTGQPSGPQVIYSAAPGSETFGKLTHENLLIALDPMNRRVAVPDRDKLYILSNVRCPAILVECGFMSNLTDISRLNDPEYQIALSSVLIGSYIQFISDSLNT